MRWIVALPVPMLFGAMPAAAQDRPAQPFEGTSVTVIAGIDGANRYSDWGVGGVYGGQIGHDWQTNGLVLGIEGEVTGSTGHQCSTSYFTTGGTARTCISTGRDVHVGGRIGTPIGGATLLYGKAGYTNLRQTFDLPAGSGRRRASSTVDGVRLGAGIERRLSGGMTLKAEYRYSHYDGSVDRHQGVLGLGLRF